MSETSDAIRIWGMNKETWVAYLRTIKIDHYRYLVIMSLCYIPKAIILVGCSILCMSYFVTIVHSWNTKGCVIPSTQSNKLFWNIILCQNLNNARKLPNYRITGKL